MAHRPGTPLADIDDILVTALDVSGRWPVELREGEPYWLDVSGTREWDQLYEPPRIEFAAGLSSARKQEVRDHIDDVVDFYHQRLGFRVPGVIVHYGDPEHVGCSGYYRAPVISMADCLDIFAHEYVHAIQEHVVAGGVHPPLWLREGDADFWAALYADARGERDYARYVRELVLPSARREGFVSRGLGSYSSYHIRVHVLVKLQGSETLSEFYRRAGELGSWHEAFEDLYGMTFDEFNVVFAQEMLLAPQPSQGCPVDWFEPEKTEAQASTQVCRTIEGIVTDLAGNPRRGVQVSAIEGTIRHEDGSRDANQLTESDGEFSLTVPAGFHTLSLLPGVREGFAYYHASRGFTLFPASATLLDATSADPERLAIEYGRLAGRIITEDGQPFTGLHVRLVRERSGSSKSAPGAFAFIATRRTYHLELLCAGIRSVGWYGGEDGYIGSRSQATPIVLEDSDVTDIVITIPDSIRCE